MKTKTGFVVGTLATLALMSPSFAVEPGPTSARETAPPAKKPSAFTLPHHATGKTNNRECQDSLHFVPVCDPFHTLFVSLQAHKT